MDLKQLLIKLDSIDCKVLLKEGRLDDLRDRQELEHGRNSDHVARDTMTGHTAKKTEKGIQYTKKDLPGQDTSKDADTKQAERRAKKKANEGNRFTYKLSNARAAGQNEFEVDGEKYPVKEAQDKLHADEQTTGTFKTSVYENHAPGQEQWIKDNFTAFVTQYGEEIGVRVLNAASWQRSKNINEQIDLEKCYQGAMSAYSQESRMNEAANLEECCGQTMMSGKPEQESGMNINASTDTRTGHKSLTVTAQGEAAEELARLLKLSGLGRQPAPEGNMQVSVESDYANEPTVEVQGLESQLAQGNDMHRPKNSFPKVSGGDNPMAMREAQELAEIERRLNEELAAFKVVAEGLGPKLGGIQNTEAKGKKPDFLDMDKDGDKKEPMKKAIADKSKKK